MRLALPLVHRLQHAITKDGEFYGKHVSTRVSKVMWEKSFVKGTLVQL